MKIAVIGTGNIGSTLGRAFAEAGHEVLFGSRTPDDASVAGDTRAQVADVATAVGASEVIVLAIPGRAVEQFGDEHAAALEGKLVVDCTNNLGGQGPTNGRAALSTSVRALRYARAFNTLGFENFQNPRFGGETADLFYASANADRPTVEALVTAVGLRPVFVGEDAEDAVDGLLPLWFTLSRQRGRHLAFKLLED